MLPRGPLRAGLGWPFRVKVERRRVRYRNRRARHLPYPHPRHRIGVGPARCHAPHVECGVRRHVLQLPARRRQRARVRHRVRCDRFGKQDRSCVGEGFTVDHKCCHDVEGAGLLPSQIRAAGRYYASVRREGSSNSLSRPVTPPTHHNKRRSITRNEFPRTRRDYDANNGRVGRLVKRVSGPIAATSHHDHHREANSMRPD